MRAKKKAYGRVKHKTKAQVSKVQMGRKVLASVIHVIEHLHTLLGEVQKIQITQRAMLRKLGVIVATQKELADGLTALGAQVDKIATETEGLKEKVAELEQALNNAGDNVPEEVTAAFNAVKEKLQALDDKVADATPEVPDEDGG